MKIQHVNERYFEEAMSEQQREDYLAFVANFVHQLHQHGVKVKQAKTLTMLAASTLLATVLHVNPRTADEITEAWVTTMLYAALKREYRGEA